MSKSLEKLWIILPTGLCLIHRDYSKNGTKESMSIDEFLFSSYISALFSTVSQLNLDQIEAIKMKGSSIYYRNYEKFIIAFQMDQKSKIHKNLEKYLEAVSNLLFTEGNFLLNSDIVDRLSSEYEQLVKKIDLIFNFKAPKILVEEQKQIELTLLNYFQDQISVEDTANQLKEFFGEQHATTEMKRNLTKIIDDIGTTIEQLGLEQSSEQKKFDQLMKHLFNWLEYSLEFLHRGW
ncbi:MAG: hypothetical protein ACFFAO_19250 [Candidatus Hermodarchaeota archaeon]